MQLLTSYSFQIQAIFSALDDGNVLKNRGGFSDIIMAITNLDGTIITRVAMALSN